MRISDWSSDVCSSDLGQFRSDPPIVIQAIASGKQRAMGFMPNDIMREIGLGADIRWIDENKIEALMDSHAPVTLAKLRTATHAQPLCISPRNGKRLLRYRSEKPTSDLQALMSTLYAAFCLKKKRNTT